MTILTATPILLPDELVRSYAIRVRLRNAHAKPAFTLDALFGSPKFALDATLAGPLDVFAAIVGSPVEDVIDRHTHLPWHRPFLHPDSYADAQQALATRDIRRLRLRFKRAQVPQWRTNEPLAFCPACCREDIKLRGYSYWRRTHQLTVLRYCPEHRLELIDRCPSCQSPALAAGDWRLPAERCAQCGGVYPELPWTIESTNDAFWDRVGCFAAAVLAGEFPAALTYGRQAALTRRADELGLGKEFTLWRNLTTQLQKFAGLPVLARLGLDPNAGPSRGWVGLCLMGAAYSEDPAGNLFMAALLFDSVPAYLDALRREPVDRNYGRKSAPVIAPKRPIGPFGVRRLREALRKARDDGVAHALGINEDVFDQILRESPRLRRIHRVCRRHFRFLATRRRYRSRILELLQNSHFRNRSELRLQDPYANLWLERNDRLWLEEQLANYHWGPDPEGASEQPASQISEIDAATASRIEDLASTARRGKEFPERLTRTWFLSQLGGETWIRTNNHEPPREFRRLFGVSHAAVAGSVSLR